jgi:cyanate permease
MVLVVGIPIVARFIRERPADRSAATVLDGVSIREGVTSRVFWILVVVLFAQSIAQNGALTHMSALLTDRGVPASGAALALSAMGAASLSGRLATGWLLDRFFAPRVGFCLLSVAAVGTYLLAGAQSLAVGVVAAGLIGFGMGAEADVTPYILSRYLGLRSFAMLYGLTWTAYAIAGAVGPVLMGRAFDATGSYTALLTQLAVGTFLIAALMLLMPRYAQPSGPRSAEASGLAQP